MSTNLTADEEYQLFYSECATIASFLKSGIETIRNIVFPDEGMLLNAMFSLSQGIERFLKVDYALLFEKQNNRFPDSKEFKTLGHNIKTIFSELILLTKQLGISNNRLDSIKNHEEPYESIINILSDFASMLRYHNLNMLSDTAQNITPAAKWHLEVEEKVIQNKIITINNEKLLKAEFMDSRQMGMLILYDYEKNKIDTFKEQYLIEVRQSVIDKYTKMYLCHIIQALYHIFNQTKYSANLYEFFTPFVLDDAYLRSRKTFKN